jgi:hypothetical protein
MLIIQLSLLLLLLSLLSIYRLYVPPGESPTVIIFIEAQKYDSKKETQVLEARTF